MNEDEDKKERSKRRRLNNYNRKLLSKRHYVPEMRTCTKMKNVASDRARRENVPRHILF